MYEINLLPPKLQRKFNIDVKKAAAFLGLTFLITGLAGGYGVFLFQLYGARSEINRIETRLQQIAPQVAEVEQIRKERLAGEKQVKAFQTIVDNRFTFTPMLEDIACNLPVDTWLTGITVENREEYAPPGGFASPPGMLAETVEDSTGEAPKTPAGAPGTGNGQKPAQPANRPVQGQKDKTAPPPPPNVLVLQGVSYTPASVGVLVHNLARLPYFQSVNVIKVYENTGDEAGQAFTIEAQLREVQQDVAKPELP